MKDNSRKDAKIAKLEALVKKHINIFSLRLSAIAPALLYLLHPCSRARKITAFINGHYLTSHVLIIAYYCINLLYFSHTMHAGVGVT